MIGGFLGGLANAGRVVQGADEAQGEALKRAIIALQLRQAQEQDQATALAGRALPSIARGGGIPGGGLPQGLPQGMPQGMPPYQPGQVQQQPLLSPSMRYAPPQQAGGLPQGGEDQVVKGSWFGNQPGWVDKMSGPETASGRPLSEPGIALPSRATLGQEFDVTPPSGQTMRLPQTDVGPAAWTGRGVDINSAAAERMGYTPQTFPTDQPFKIHPVVKQELMKTGLEAVRAGIPPPAVRDSMSTAKNATSDLDPARFGSYGLPEIAQAIEKTSPDAPPAVKYLAAAQLHKLLAPDQQQMLKLLMQQQKNELTTAFKDREYWLRERGLEEREREARAREARPPASATPNYQLYEPKTPGAPPRAFDTKSGTFKEIPGMEGAARIGTAKQGRWSDDAMEALVRQGMAGDPTILQKLPRSGPARQQYEETLAATMKDMEGGIAGGTATMMMNQMRMAEARSAAQTAGRVTMNTELFSREAQGAGQQVIETSKLFPRTEIPLVNAALAAYEQNTGDPNVIRFGAAIFSLLNAYGKMSNPTGTGIHDVDKQRLADILDRRATQGQVEAAVQQIITEGKVVSDAAFHAQEDVLKRIVPGAGGQPPATPGQPSAGAGGSYNTEADIMQAIESGSLSREAGTKLLIDKFGWRQ